MKVTAVNFTSARVRSTCIKPSETNTNKKINPYRVSDILPMSIGFGAGLSLAYLFLIGKPDGVKKFLKLA